MRSGTVVALGVAAAGLGAWILFFEGERATTDETARQAKKLLPGFDRDDVRGIEIERPGAPRVALERPDDGVFRLTAPIATRADRAATDDLLGALGGAEARRILPDARNRPDYGFADPHTTIRVRSKARSVVLHLGKPDAGGEFLFAARDAEAAVYVIPKRLAEATLRSADALRERTAVPRASELPNRLVVDGTTLVHSGERWHTQDGVMASRTLAEETERQVRELRVTRFLPSESPAVATVERRLQLDAEPAELGGVCPGAADEVLGQRTGAEAARFCVRRADLAKIALPEDRLRERALVVARAEGVTRIAVTGPGAVALAKGETKWTLEGGGAADDEAVRAWIAELGTWRARAIVPISEAKGLAGAVEIRLDQGGGTEGIVVDTVHIGALLDGRRYARRGEEPVALVLDAEVERSLPRGALTFRARQVTSFSRWDAVRIVAGDEHLEKSEERWQLRKPVALEADADAVDRLLQAASELRAVRFEAEAPLPVHGLGTPRRIEIQGKTTARDGGAPPLHVIEVGADAPGGCFARVRSDEPGSTHAVMVIARAVCEDLRAHLASRKVLDLDEERLERIALSGARSVTLEKRGPAWYRGSGAADSAEVDALVSVLHDLKATRVLGYDEGPLPRELTVSLHAGDRDVVVGVGKDADRVVLVVRGRPVRYEVAPEVLDRLKGPTKAR